MVHDVVFMEAVLPLPASGYGGTFIVMGIKVFLRRVRNTLNHSYIKRSPAQSERQ